MNQRPRCICLLPARNAQAHLPGHLDSVSVFADAIVALDDGSTDDTGDILQSHPLVEILLTNHKRQGYRGWDDLANRMRLLRAARELEPAWVVFLDADERLDPEDARALATAVRHGELEHGSAYGFQHFRMWKGGMCDPDFRWIYRMFAFAPAHELPPVSLHFDPVPTAIPRESWVRTTIRVQHFGADSEAAIANRLAKYREVDPSGRFQSDSDGLNSPPRTLAPWRRRLPGLPFIYPEESDPTVRAPGTVDEEEADPTQSRPLLACLLPARNCEGDLHGYFESVSTFADLVVALDDGSTDDTRAALESQPLVEIVLSHPRREDFAGWDDAGNRNELLAACERLRPRWILSLDADERIDPDDARALRAFLSRDAIPGLAYGFRVHRMIGEGAYDRAELWAYRLFAYETGQRFPDQRLHLVPIPTSIPPERWMRTTVRIQHFAGSDPARRKARFDKYIEADPTNSFQDDYSILLAPPEQLIAWEPRPSGLPVLLDEEGAAAEFDPDLPVLSAIVISQDDAATIRESVQAVLDQECDSPFEVIVVTSGTDGTADVVRESFPQVRLVELPSAVLPGVARNAGLRLARGEFVSFPGSHVSVAPRSFAARVAAHESGFTMVTGSIVNGTTTRAGWASYFLDHSIALPGRPSEELGGPPAHCSYEREALLGIGGFPEDMRAGEDTVVNGRLWRLGYRAFRSQGIVLTHRSPCSTTRRLLSHHYTRGRSMGRILLEEHDFEALSDQEIAFWLFGYVPRRMRSTRVNVRRWGAELQEPYRRAQPLIGLGALAAWVGMWFELVSRRGLRRVLRDAGRSVARTTARSAR